ncbi:hypothetical protein [Nocardia terpenica]|uniref:Wadjet protein JetD C-terminal domain-containing protein n=1 Tax=Nocardia terpenica TaxID=455432 RepID=A0A6G9YYL7_9NOCA|nr:hypothetical protein [Nocardia terpenica]QIS18338.1 hypothetical protein F6W96_08625 [Nocardia terpenica]
MADNNTIELPPRSSRRPWPGHIIVPACRTAPKSKPWVAYAWRAELGWAASLRTLSDELFSDLVAINTWLSRHASQSIPIVPVCYRSAEILGKEKRLDDLTRTTLFDSGRLTLDLLACTRYPPPLPAAVVGPGPDVLIVENSDTYWVLDELLSNAANHPIGAGSGRTFPAQVGALDADVAGRGSVTGTAWYWGDFDPAGIAIAEAATFASTAVPIRPARELWSVMADRPIQVRDTVDWSGVNGDRFLGPELWSQLAHIRSAHGRIAQEAVPVTTLAQWVKGLR